MSVSMAAHAGRVPAPAPGGQADVHVQLRGDGARDGRSHVLPADARSVHQGVQPDPAKGAGEEPARAQPAQGARLDTPSNAVSAPFP